MAAVPGSDNSSPKYTPFHDKPLPVCSDVTLVALAILGLGLLSLLSPAVRAWAQQVPAQISQMLTGQITLAHTLLLVSAPTVAGTLLVTLTVVFIGQHRYRAKNDLFDPNDQIHECINTAKSLGWDKSRHWKIIAATTFSCVLIGLIFWNIALGSPLIHNFMNSSFETWKGLAIGGGAALGATLSALAMNYAYKQYAAHQREQRLSQNPLFIT